MKNVQFTDDEIRVLISILDIAVRANGLQIAANAIHLAGKLQNADTEEELIDGESE